MDKLRRPCNRIRAPPWGRCVRPSAPEQRNRLVPSLFPSRYAVRKPSVDQVTVTAPFVQRESCPEESWVAFPNPASAKLPACLLIGNAQQPYSSHEPEPEPAADN